MLKKLKISLIFFIFFLLFFSIQTFAFDYEFISGNKSMNNLTPEIYSNFDYNTIYLSEYTSNIYYNFFPLYINNNDFVFTAFSNSYTSSSVTYDLPMYNLLDTYYYINSTYYNPNFTKTFRDTSNNLNYSIKRSITFYDEQFIYSFSVCDWSNDYFQYCGGLYKDSNDYIDYLVGEVRIIFEKYDYINNSLTSIYKGVVNTNNFSFNTAFPDYNLNNYNVIPCYNYVASINYQLGFAKTSLNYTLTFSNHEITFNNSTNYDFLVYNSTGSYFPSSFDTNDIIYPVSSSVSPVNKTVSFYFDDYNLMKRFKYNLNLPLYSNYSKYFAFLNNVNRTTANSVELDLDIYIIDLPNEYITENGYSSGYADLFNFLMYDNKEKCFFFPYGMRLKHYKATGFNNSTMNLTLINDTITTRYDFNTSFFDSFLKDPILNGSNTYIFKTTDLLASNYISSLFLRSVSAIPSINVPNKLGIFNWSSFDKNYQTNFNDYLINYLYYSTTSINYQMSDLLFSNYNVTSFEHTFKEFSSIVTWYEIFNHTTLYSQQNKLTEDNFYSGYYDNNDLSSLPEITNNYNFVNNLYLNTDNSSSGGSIIYNIDDLANRNNDSVDYNDSIDYDNELNLYNLPYIVGLIKDLTDNNNDNTPIDNNYSDIINNLKDYSTPLRAIYLMLENIDNDINELPSKIKFKVKSTSKDINDTINHLITTDEIQLEDVLNGIDIALKSCLGLVSEPYYLVTYITSRVSNFNSNDMYLDLPNITIMNYTILNNTRLDFTTFFNSNSNLTYALNISRLFGDFVLTMLLFTFLKSTYKEVMKDDN